MKLVYQLSIIQIVTIIKKKNLITKNVHRLYSRAIDDEEKYAM